MSKKRNYVEEILDIKNRNNKTFPRYELIVKRVHPLVEGFRTIKKLPASTSFRNEWLKYGAIGYVAIMEGYFRLLIADLINAGSPYKDRIVELREIKFTPEVVLAIQDKKVTLGEFIAHLLPINRLSDIDNHLSVLLGTSFLKSLKAAPTYPPTNMKPFGELFPNTFPHIERLFELRHIYAHELATKEKVPVKLLESYIGSSAHFIYQTEVFISEKVGI
ncbi:hypothetical protein ACOIWC_004253 [Vibrio vulnificus]